MGNPLSVDETQQWDAASRLIDVEEYAKALLILDRILACSRDVPKLYAYRGYVLFRLEKYADAHAHMGFCLERLGRLEDAKSAYGTALTYDPKESLALAGLRELGQPRA